MRVSDSYRILLSVDDTERKPAILLWKKGYRAHPFYRSRLHDVLHEYLIDFRSFELLRTWVLLDTVQYVPDACSQM